MSYYATLYPVRFLRPPVVNYVLRGATVTSGATVQYYGDVGVESLTVDGTAHFEPPAPRVHSTNEDVGSGSLLLFRSGTLLTGEVRVRSGGTLRVL